MVKVLTVLSLCLIQISRGFADFSPRIVGGNEAARGQAPWQVLILRQDNKLKPYCSGSLISDNWVLTSAQCVYGSQNLSVILGRNFLSAEDVSVEGGEVQKPKQVVIHTNYNPHGGGRDDIALVQLKTPIEVTKYIHPVRLQSSVPTIESTEGKMVRAFGWGVSSDDQWSPSIELRPLKVIDMTIISMDECKLTYGTYVQISHLCATAVKNGSICERDQGGSLVMQEADGLWTMVGVASYFDSLSCETDRPSGFTRVSWYLNWIFEHSGVRQPIPENPGYSHEAKLGDVPSAASVWAVVKNASHGEGGSEDGNIALPFCTGAILSSSQVIVTTSCLDRVSAPSVPVVVLQVAAGIVRTGDLVEDRIEVKDMVRYGSETFGESVAILTLAKKLKVNASSPLQIIGTSTTSVAEGSNCVISGWQQVKQGDVFSAYLTLGNVTVDPSSRCSVRPTGTHGTLCVKPSDDFYKCVAPQDGGMLVCDGRLAGLYSASMDTAHQCSDARHFLQVKQFNTWIDQQLGGGGGRAAIATPTLLFVAIAYLSACLRTH